MGSVRIVVQRCTKASVLVDYPDKLVSIGRGMILYISFVVGAKQNEIRKIARYLLSLPILTLGSWGDGTKAMSYSKLFKQGHPLEILVVPQACLVSTLKGSNLQYHEQLHKEQSEDLYYYFIHCLMTSVQELDKKAEDWKPRSHIPQELLFKTGVWEGQFSQYDSNHVPTHDFDGKELSKSRRKKLLRILESNNSKNVTISASMDSSVMEQTLSLPAEELQLNHNFLLGLPGFSYVKFGRFGGLQALTLESSCGPNTHYFEM